MLTDACRSVQYRFRMIVRTFIDDLRAAWRQNDVMLLWQARTFVVCEIPCSFVSLCMCRASPVCQGTRVPAGSCLWIFFCFFCVCLVLSAFICAGLCVVFLSLIPVSRTKSSWDRTMCRKCNALPCPWNVSCQCRLRTSKTRRRMTASGASGSYCEISSLSKICPDWLAEQLAPSSQTPHEACPDQRA